MESCDRISLFHHKGKGKIIAREHFRQTEKSARELKQEVLNRFSFCSWQSFVERNFKAFPRYVRDQCLLAQKNFPPEQTDQRLLEHAVEFCLANNTYSMKDLADTYRFYEGWIRKETPSQPSEPLRVGKKHAVAPTIRVAQRELGEYTALIQRPAGELS